MWDGLLIEYHTTRTTVGPAYWQVDSWLEESKKTHSQLLIAVRTFMQVGN